MLGLSYFFFFFFCLCFVKVKSKRKKTVIKRPGLILMTRIRKKCTIIRLDIVRTYTVVNPFNVQTSHNTARMDRVLFVDVRPLVRSSP